MRPPLLLTPGDPRGVGPEISIEALRRQPRSVVMLGDIPTLQKLAPELQVVQAVSEGEGLRALALPEGTEPIEVRALRVAVDLCLQGKGRALVTGPIHKARLHAQGFQYNGHTDFLGDLCGVPQPIMAFVGGQDTQGHPLRVALVTVHVPLSAVPALITPERVYRTIQVAHQAAQQQLKLASPRITVCGLNPHAGEAGLLGQEEILAIAPACEAARKAGMQIWGPVSAETAFIEADQSDMIIAMYHDQALVPLKALGFGRCVNWSLGLPIIRTSVDHGTADALVGTGRAKPDSLLAALDLAERLTF